MIERRRFDDIEMAREAALARHKLSAALAQKVQPPLRAPMGSAPCVRFFAMPRDASAGRRFLVAVQTFWTILRSPNAPTDREGD